jgi:hypothetical protein
MKIIGMTENGCTGYNSDYLVQISPDELARVCGFSYASNAAWGSFVKAHLDGRGILKCGSEIPVSDFWSQLNLIRDCKKDLQKTAETLRGLADLIDGSWSILSAKIDGEK